MGCFVRADVPFGRGLCWAYGDSPGGEPWFGSLLGSGNSMYDVIGGIALLALGVACVQACRRAVTERIQETEVDVEAVRARVREFD